MAIPIKLRGDESKIQSFLKLLNEEHPHTRERVSRDDSGLYHFKLKFNPEKDNLVIKGFFNAHGWRFCSCSIDESGVSCEC